MPVQLNASHLSHQGIMTSSWHIERSNIESIYQQGHDFGYSRISRKPSVQKVIGLNKNQG